MILVWPFFLILFSIPFVYSIGNVNWILKDLHKWSKRKKQLLACLAVVYLGIFIYYGFYISLFFVSIFSFIIWRIVWRLERKWDSKVSVKWSLIWVLGLIFIFFGFYFNIIPLGFTINFVLVGFIYWWYKEKREHGGVINKRLIIYTLSLPIFVYSFIIFSFYAIYCENVRKVDFGIGDRSMYVPVGNGYFLDLLEEPSGGYLVKDLRGIEINEEKIIDNLNVEGDNIIGEYKNSSRFIFNTKSEILDKYEKNSTEWNKNKIPLMSALEFYKSRRWLLIDAIIFYLSLVPVIFYTRFWWLKNVGSKLNKI